MSDEDRTFADSGTEVPVESESPELEPESFDFVAWLAGATPIRKSVTIYADGAAQAKVDQLLHREAMLPAGTERDAVRRELVDLHRRIEHSAATFVIEGRTSDWISATAKALKKDKVPDDMAGLHLTAAQIVSPEGVTAEGLQKLSQVNEPAVNQIMRAAIDANTRPIGLDPRFLPAASV